MFIRIADRKTLSINMVHIFVARKTGPGKNARGKSLKWMSRDCSRQRDERVDDYYFVICAHARRLKNSDSSKRIPG